MYSLYTDIIHTLGDGNEAVSYSPVHWQIMCVYLEPQVKDSRGKGQGEEG